MTQTLGCAELLVRWVKIKYEGLKELLFYIGHFVYILHIGFDRVRFVLGFIGFGCCCLTLNQFSSVHSMESASKGTKYCTLWFNFIEIIFITPKIH